MTKLYLIKIKKSQIIFDTRDTEAYVYSYAFSDFGSLIKFLKSILKNNKSILVLNFNSKNHVGKHFSVENNELKIGIELKNTLENYLDKSMFN
ncbi:hypothetical protein OAT67_00520 [Bacteriovoracaceae bacterium]|nr:hypothetical protein [Bacteriovoracaceae bacterium]|tara:strand:+ start:192015 stop:192293 length:279 start_codon:yes stop_codon:yes gene_type:complete